MGVEVRWGSLFWQREGVETRVVLLQKTLPWGERRGIELLLLLSRGGLGAVP